MYLSHNEGEWQMPMELLLKILEPSPTNFYPLMTKNGLKIRFAKTALWCPLNYTIINRRATMDWRDLWFPATVVCGCICKMMLQTVGVLYLKSDQPVFSSVWHDWFIWYQLIAVTLDLPKTNYKSEQLSSDKFYLIIHHWSVLHSCCWRSVLFKSLY